MIVVTQAAQDMGTQWAYAYAPMGMPSVSYVQRNIDGKWCIPVNIDNATIHPLSKYTYDTPMYPQLVVNGMGWGPTSGKLEDYFSCIRVDLTENKVYDRHTGELLNVTQLRNHLKTFGIGWTLTKCTAFLTASAEEKKPHIKLLNDLMLKWKASVAVVNTTEEIKATYEELKKSLYKTPLKPSFHWRMKNGEVTRVAPQEEKPAEEPKTIKVVKPSGPSYSFGSTIGISPFFNEMAVAVKPEGGTF